MVDHQDIAYSHDSHRIFNERFETKMPSRDLTGPWISGDKIPVNLRRTFDMNRDPYIKRQLLAQEKTEAERREKQGRGSRMIEQDKPALHLRPPPEIRKPIERRDFGKRWLAEQRNAALSQSHIPKNQNERLRHHQRTGPERSR